MKKYVIGFILGIVFSASVVYAANYLYHADEVSYSPKNINWNVDSVDEAIDELYLKISQAHNALLNLKNTDIGKAVATDGDTLDSVVDALSNITNYGNKSFTINSTSGITIPAGYYNGQGTITTSGLIPTPTATRTITTNGNNIDVMNYSKVNVAVSSCIPKMISRSYSVSFWMAGNNCTYPKSSIPETFVYDVSRCSNARVYSTGASLQASYDNSSYFAIGSGTDITSYNYIKVTVNLGCGDGVGSCSNSNNRWFFE